MALLAGQTSVGKTLLEGAVGAEFGAVGFSAVTRAAIPAKTLPKSMGGGCVAGPGANRSFKAVKVLTTS